MGAARGATNRDDRRDDRRRERDVDRGRASPADKREKKGSGEARGARGAAGRKKEGRGPRNAMDMIRGHIGADGGPSKRGR